MSKHSNGVIHLVDEIIYKYSKYNKYEEQFNIDFDHVPDPVLQDVVIQMMKDDPGFLENLLFDIFSERIEEYNQDKGCTNQTDYNFARG